MFLLLCSCKNYSQDLSLDVNNYYGTWQLYSLNSVGDYEAVNVFYTFNSDGTVKEKIGDNEYIHTFRVRLLYESDPSKVKQISAQLEIRTDLYLDPETYGVDLFINDDNKLSLGLENRNNFKSSLYIKVD